MFRLADYEKSDPGLYAFLSAIASQTIFRALDDLFGSICDVEDFYENVFAGPPIGALDTDFFAGLADYISERSSMKETDSGDKISEDGRAGMELMDRKIKRMKAKMLEPDHYYTFDLFEELLFHIVIETFGMMDEKPSKELRKKIKSAEDELIGRFEVDEDEAAYLSESVHRIEKMGLDDGELFFWDDDFAFVFDKGLVDGIRKLIGGEGLIMGYGYQDVCSIFTDAGIKAPLLLVGTEAAYQARGEAAQEKMAEAMKSMPVPEPTGDFRKWLEEQGIEEDDLPFS